MTFVVDEPDSLAEALDILAQGDEMTRPISGGSGIALMIKYGFLQPTRLVSLRRFAEDLSDILVLPDGGLEIGAAVALRDIEDSTDVASRAPILTQSLKRLATIRLRNVARVGGAVAHGAPQMDLPPVLIALGAEIQASNRQEERWIAAEDMFLGYYQTAINPDELITRVRVPGLGEHKGYYRKVTAHTVDDWPLLGIAALARFENGSVKSVGAAIGALSDHAQPIRGLNASLTGSRPSSDDIRSAAEEAADSLEYREGGLASPEYQRRLVATNLRQALETVLTDSEDGRGE